MMDDRSDLTMHYLPKLLSDLVSRPPIKHAIIALESGDQSFHWIGATGELSPGGTEVQEDTPFFIASIDKLFNAVVVMKLNEEGQLDLDDPIAAYLPPELTRGIHQSGSIDYSETITVRHLLSHTSGLADWLEDRPQGGRSLIEQVIDEGDLALTMEDVTIIVRDRLAPHFPPQDLSVKRQKIRYSDTNYMLLMAIIEAVTGHPLHHVHEQMLIRPLDLRHTYFPGHSQPQDPTPEAVVLRTGGSPLHIPLMMRSLRGIYSTAEDTITFMRKFVRGEVFQNAKTLLSMQKHWNRFGFPLDRAALRSPGWPIEYGLGIMRFCLPRIFTLPHSMPPVIGHTGSTGCWLFYCPRWDMFLSGSVDEVTAGAVPYRIVPEILDILRSAS